MIYTIKNSFISVEIKSFGAELNSLKRNDKDLEYLWSGDEKYWGRKSPVLFPIVGKLLDNEYFYNNEKYEMKQHGFARDKEFKLFQQDSDSIIFTYESDENSLKIYPFEFLLYISYKLVNNKVIISYKVENKAKEEIYFSIGAHPAFNWPLCGGKKEDYFLEFELDDNLLSYKLKNSYINSSKNSLIKLESKKLALDEKLFFDDALIFKDLKVKTISYKNIINNSSIKMSFDEFEYLGIWSKPEGSPFLCIEPWCGIADFIGHSKNIENKIGINSIKKDENFQKNFTIELN